MTDIEMTFAEAMDRLGLAIHECDEYLELPSLSESHTSDLLYDEDGVRIHRERCGVSDGEPCDDKLTVELLIAGRWTITNEYDPRDGEVVGP